MLRTFLIHSLFLILVSFSLLYVDSLRHRSQIITEERSIAQNVSLKVFGKGGQEWRLTGKDLLSFGSIINLRNVRILSGGGYLIDAGEVAFDREKNVAELRGGVEIRGEALFVKTPSAVVNFRSSMVRGKGEVKVWRNRNYIEGRGFTSYMNPLTVIIREARGRHEI